MCEKPVFKKIIDFEEAKQILEQMRLDRGHPSGYKDLDNLSGGLVRKGVTLIAGRPAMGKTSLALNIVNRLSRQLEGSIFISSPCLEADSLVLRLLGIGLNTNTRDLVNASMLPENFLTNCEKYFGSGKSSIITESYPFFGVNDVWDLCYNIPNLRLIVIPQADYLIKYFDFAGGNSRITEIRDDPQNIFKTLQELAQRLNVPILCTATLHRDLEKRKNKRPRLNDLKKVGIPPEFLDQIILLYRDQYYYYQGEEGAELIVAKVAQGDVGTVRLDWDGATMRFTERGNDK